MATNRPKTLHSLEDLSRLLPAAAAASVEVASDVQRSHDGKGKSARVSLDTRGRKGKTVTVVTGLHHNPQTLEDIARVLKQHCGAGGTVKDGVIEIQGDNRARVTEKLRALNYLIK
jgi:translation initiation factor 1